MQKEEEEQKEVWKSYKSISQDYRSNMLQKLLVIEISFQLASAEMLTERSALQHSVLISGPVLSII